MEIYDDDMRFKERLIENVKKYPNLYISSRKDHWNRKLTKNCWKKISSDLKVYEKSGKQKIRVCHQESWQIVFSRWLQKNV